MDTTPGRLPVAVLLTAVVVGWAGCDVRHPGASTRRTTRDAGGHTVQKATFAATHHRGSGL